VSVFAAEFYFSTRIDGTISDWKYFKVQDTCNFPNFYSANFVKNWWSCELSKLGCNLAVTLSENP
jgi:hypothetical protein